MINPGTIRWTSSLRDTRAPNLCNQLLGRHMSPLNHGNGENEPPSTPLIGPPELYLSTPSKISQTNQYCPSKSDDHLMVSDCKKDVFFPSYPYYQPSYPYYQPSYPYYQPRPYMGYTENRSPTFFSSGNACLDFFFQVVPDTPPNRVNELLQMTWDENPLTALKLVFNLRGVRGKGKADREGFYTAALWLHEKHPKTLAYNAISVVEFGYFKDLLEILYRLLEGLHVRKKEKQDYETWKYYNPDFWMRKRENSCHGRRPGAINKEDRLEADRKGIERYNNDPNYRILHNQVSRLFADALRADLQKMREGNLGGISFAAKWCPSRDTIFDRSTLMCEAIARKLFPRDSCPEYEGMEEAHYAYKVRHRLRKEVLVSLRKAIDMPEVYMSAKQWDEVCYTRVPSIAMKNYRKTFFNHDEERFKAYLEEVKEGKAKISSGALLPHEIIASLKKNDVDYFSTVVYHLGSNDGKSYANDAGVNANEVLELQWKRTVDDLKAIGKLSNCLAICDVSGSMLGLPLDVSVALGLLISELSEEPWKGKLITFSENPQLQIIQGDSLLSKVHSIERMYWDMNTNFQRVFDKILEVAKNGNLSEDQMVKRLFVFSDMEFDQASARPLETDYEAICRKFEENGYKSVPEIVFWNLRNSIATPVQSSQKGVALVSGFSKNLIKLFLDGGGVLDPEFIMEKAISGDEYDKLVVVD